MEQVEDVNKVWYSTYNVLKKTHLFIKLKVEVIYHIYKIAFWNHGYNMTPISNI